MSAVNPIDNEELYNSIVLAGVTSPGVVTLSGHDRKIDWDVKEAPGLYGATMKPKKIPPITFTATFYLVRDDAQGIDQFEEWPAFLAVVKSSLRGTQAKALDIYHPDLASNDIRSVCQAQIGGVVHDGKGGQRIAIQFIEYRPPKPVAAAPVGAKKNEIDPDAAAKAEIARLTKQYQDTPPG